MREKEDEEANGKRRPSRFGCIALKLILLGLVLLAFEPSDEDDYSSAASPITNNASTRVMFRQSRPWGNTISMIVFYFAGSVIYSEVLMNRLLLSQSDDDNGSRRGNNNLSLMLVVHLPKLLLVALLGLALGFQKNGFGGDVAYFTFSCFTPWLVAANDAMMVVVPAEHDGGASDAKRTTSRSCHSIARLALPLALLLATTHATLFRDTETAIEFFRSPSYVNYCLSTTFMTSYFFRHVAGPFLFGNGKNAAGAALLVQLLVMVPPTAIMAFPSLINANDDNDDGSDHGVFLACDYLIHTTICLDVVVLICFCAKTFFCFSCNNNKKTKKKETKAATTKTTTREQPQRQQKTTTVRTLSSDDDDYILMVDDGSCTGESNEV